MTAPFAPDEFQRELEALAALGLPLPEHDGPAPSPEAVAQLESLAASMAYGVTPVAPAPELKLRLMAIVAAEAASGQAANAPKGQATAAPSGEALAPSAPALTALPGGQPNPPAPKGADGKVVPFPPKRRHWVWQAACAVLASGLALSLARVGYLERSLSVSLANEGRAEARLAAVEAQLAAVEGKLKLASMPTTLMQSAELRVASLAPMEPGKPGRARLFWSPKAASWMLVIGGMPMPQQGHSYQAWAVGPKGKVNLGMFMPDAEGMAMVPVAWPEGPGPNQAAAVSLEADMAPMPQPKGPIVLLGKLDGASI